MTIIKRTPKYALSNLRAKGLPDMHEETDNSPFRALF